MTDQPQPIYDESGFVIGEVSPLKKPEPKQEKPDT